LQSACCGAKHALRRFTDSIRCELIHEQSNVRITMVQMAIQFISSELRRRLTELSSKVDGDVPMIVRATQFPSNPRTEICKQIGKSVRQGGRRAVVEDTHWRHQVALRAFDLDATAFSSRLCPSGGLETKLPRRQGITACVHVSALAGGYVSARLGCPNA
jgi:NAD(P)-dependent dehydrogenase (short-subunit alcohol dehydrogenase family)